MCALIACIMLTLYAFGINPDSFHLGWLGLAVLALALVVGNWPLGLIVTRRDR